MQDTGAGALERFRLFLEAARRWRIVALPQTAQMMRAVFLPENSLLRERMRDKSMSLAETALAALLDDGNREEVFRVEDTEATARVFMILAYEVSDDMMREVVSSTLSDEQLIKQIVGRGRAFMRATEALLGIPRESLDGPDVGLLSDMVRVFRLTDTESNAHASQATASTE